MNAYSRLSVDGFGPIERIPLAQGRSHQRHVSIDKAPSSSLGSFQFHHGLAEESSPPGGSPAAPPGFTPIAPWLISSQQSTLLGPPSMVTGGPIKDAGIRDTTLYHHEFINHGSVQPLTLLGSSPITLPPAGSAPLDVGGSQKHGNLYSSLFKGQSSTSNASPQDKAQAQSNLDSLEQAFLVSKDTPPHEQLLGPDDGNTLLTKGGSELHSILSNLPRHLKVNIPQQQHQSSISILQAAGQQQRSSQSQTVYNDMVTVTPTQPIAAQRKAGSSSGQAAMRESYKAIQEMKINKVKMPPLKSHASASKTTSVAEEENFPPKDSAAVSQEDPDALSEKSSLSSRILSDAPVGSLSHTFSKLGPESSAWLGEMIPAASIGDCPLEVGSFRVFLLRIDEGSSLNPRAWTGLRSKLVLRACLKEDVDEISNRLVAELNATAASKGLDKETCKRISVVPLGQGVVEPSGGQGKRVFLSISSELEEEGKPSLTKADPKATQAVDVPLVMETLLRSALPQGFVVHHVHLASPAHSPTRTNPLEAKGFEGP